MPRPNAPWYRSSRDVWCVKINGKLTTLGVKGRENARAAREAFRKLIAGCPPKPPKPSADPTVADGYSQFLYACSLTLKPKTVARYRYDIGVFVKGHGDTPLTLVTPDLIRTWVAGLTVKPPTKGIMLRSLSAMFGWLVREDKLAANPVSRVKKPRTSSRSDEALIPLAVHQKLLAGASTQFRDVLTVLHATGCRPGEVEKITAKSLQPASRVVVIHEHKADQTGRPRKVIVNSEVLTLLERLCKRHPTGPLLRSSKGKGWTGRTITSAMWNLSKKVGVKAVAYGYRHTYVTEGLMAGVSNAIMASLVGHSGTTVIDKYYSHLGAAGDVLREAAKFREQGKGNPTANPQPDPTADHAVFRDCGPPARTPVHPLPVGVPAPERVRLVHPLRSPHVRPGPAGEVCWGG